MLSRRSVRIKILQLLYSMDRDSELTFKEVKQKYNESIDQSFELFIYTMYNLSKICEVAVEDESKRKTKHLPGDYDKVFTAKIFNKSGIADLLNDTKFSKKVQALGYDKLSLGDFYKSVYEEFAKTEEYKDYILKGNESPDSDTEILLELFRYCRKSEYFEEVMEDRYSNWIDEKSLVVGVVKKFIKSLKDKNFDFDQYYPDDETCEEFGESLINKVNDIDADLMQAIEGVIQNWDTERLAIIDTIILKLALCEMMIFPSIPTKVSINEYVDISKTYSTEKSKEFINGILDTLMKDFIESGKIKKEGRGLVE